jgi:hypothetical protein
MFTMRFRDLFGSDGVSCIKLPAAVAFPTDDRLLQRIGELRRALPANNVKPLLKCRELASQVQPKSPLGERDVEQQLLIKMPQAGPSVVPMARPLARVRDGRASAA